MVWEQMPGDRGGQKRCVWLLGVEPEEPDLPTTVDVLVEVGINLMSPVENVVLLDLLFAHEVLSASVPKTVSMKPSGL